MVYVDLCGWWVRTGHQEDMKLDSGDNVVWFQNDDGHYLIKKVQVDILD